MKNFYFIVSSQATSERYLRGKQIYIKLFLIFISAMSKVFFAVPKIKVSIFSRFGL